MTDIVHQLSTPTTALAPRGSAVIIDRLHQALDALAAFIAMRRRRTLEIAATRHRLRGSRVAVSRESYRDFNISQGLLPWSHAPKSHKAQSPAYR